MKLLFYFTFFYFVGCCPSKKVMDESTSKITMAEIRILSKNCEYVKNVFSNPLDLVKNNIYDQNLKFVYKYNYKKVNLLSTTSCFIGNSRSQMVKMLGQPSGDFDDSYYFYSKDGKSWVCELFFENNYLVKTDVLSVKRSF